jgi:lipopolysaccharide/colanic/teichoic acid biosynthesis glycosyltransferase
MNLTTPTMSGHGETTAPVGFDALAFPTWRNALMSTLISSTPIENPPIPSTPLLEWPRVSLDAPRALRSSAKRAIDLIGAVLGLLFLAPILALLALLIRIDSPGPVLFRQRRRGLDGQVFSMLKLRTMRQDAEERLQELEARNESAGGVLFKMRDDPRVTRLGRFLRRTSLDELPQLWNVVLGEMSLVGPRPLQLRDSALLGEKDPAGYMGRLSVLPGLTGPWQVSGRSDLDSEGMVKLDLEYVANWSLGLDLRLLCQTVTVVLNGRGAR